MKVIITFLVLLLSLPAAAKDDKKKDEKKPPKKTPVELMLDEADAKAAAGDKDGAARVLREAAAMPNAGGEPLMRLGRLLEAGHELDSAIDAYKAAAAALMGPGKGEALGRMALLQEARVMGDAGATAEQAVAADPEGVWPLVALSRSRTRQKKLDEAKALAEKARAASGGAAASAALGYVHEAVPDLATAEASYREALAAEAGRLDATVGLARVLRKMGRASEAEPLLQEILNAAPGAVEAYKESARVKAALGRAEDAMNDATIAATLAEGDADTKRLSREMTIAKAVADARKGQADFALQDLQNLQRQEDAADVRVGIARVHMAKRDAAAATAELDKALALSPESADVHFALGYLHHALKQNAKAALPEYEKAVALDPENTEYRTYLGAVLSELQMLDRAEAELVKVTSSPGYNKPDAWIYLGGAYLNAKKYKEAAAALEKALALAPDVLMANAYMAWAQFALKDAPNFIKYGGKARTLGYKDTRFLENLTKVEAGEVIK